MPRHGEIGYGLTYSIDDKPDEIRINILNEVRQALEHIIVKEIDIQRSIVSKEKSEDFKQGFLEGLNHARKYLINPVLTILEND